MKIKTIEINNYKAFLGKHPINVNEKNLFIYGENGSGKSSLYFALKDFFQSSMEDIVLEDLENIFVEEKNQGKTSIEVSFKPNPQGDQEVKAYLLNNEQNATREETDTSIRDGNKLKSFLTYKHLLDIHNIKKDESINLFNLLVKGVLKHFKFSLTKGKELGELWAEVESSISQKTGRSYPINKKKPDVDAAIKLFNEAFKELFNEESPEYILKHTKPILNKFNHNIDLVLYFPHVRPNSDYTSLLDVEVSVELTYAGKKIKKPHLFLNEARLSAIAISIYLGMIKRHIQLIPCKILFLDDIFIGLDIANRLPLLEILESEFQDYQIFITTYDKPWFEYVRGMLEGKSNWKTMEFYAQHCQEGIEIPKIFDGENLIKKANKHFQQSDYKAAAVYIRSAFEKILQKYCEKHRISIAFKSDPRNYTSEDFWIAIKSKLSPQTQKEIEAYRNLVLNPFSHYNTRKHEIKTELEKAIKAVTNLKKNLNDLDSK